MLYTLALAFALGGFTGKAGATTKGVQLLVQRTSAGQAFEVRNNLNVPVNAVLGLSRMVNASGMGQTIIQKSIPPGSTVRLATIRKRDNRYPLMFKHSFSYAVNYKTQPYKPNESLKEMTGSVYELPWVGGPFRVSQGAGGDFSHDTPKGRYAVDVAMPVGTPIIAARAGVILEVQDGQPGPSPNPAGNFVRIQHDDGSHTAYLHLSRGSLRVKEGQRVKVGTLLGNSGNTGRSTGPHLHFVVQKEIAGSMISVPFRFSRPVGSLPNFARND
ncbi:M23 family metallopeptidase [Azomonas macrocytogenes]|uniref:Murein DD-endopeptidase MepM/ murein hydrolase activator NlpD n=1 Tax=Azomonas macrocytogenes TaxID=69962 RepID=A0A839T5L1_AZOMA|nr:M23 family metallopeptidase [Azomonas macrocytogenes]MBB3104378.1 murein DD-endopeptidase MepM/ murein hydrolase activator NlpD [Azomonas macrocytogenes]